jgi:hypothetical protein
MRALLWLLIALPLAAQDFCAVRVSIFEPDGEPVSPPATLIGPDGKVVQSFTAVNGHAEFCDFGFGEHTIHIGGDECGSVTLPHISFVFGVPQEFEVVLNPCFRGGDDGRRPVCVVYFRVTSADGKKLGAAELSVEGAKRVIHADGFGRIFTGVPNGAAQDYKLSAPGYADKMLHVSCRAFETIQKAVKLAPLPSDSKSESPR